MGSFISTQLAWEQAADGKWSVPSSPLTDHAVYLLYIELCEVYLEWDRARDGAADDEAQSDLHVLLTTPFAKPLQFTSRVNLSALLGKPASQARLDALLVQQHRRAELKLDDYDSPGKADPRKSGRFKPKRSLCNVFDPADPAYTSVWARMPLGFWRAYSINDGLSLLRSRDTVTAALDARGGTASTSPRVPSGLSPRAKKSRFPRQADPPPAVTPAYQLADDADALSCTVCNLRHAVGHLSLLATLAYPELAKPAAQALAVDSEYIGEAVRGGLVRAYFFINGDSLVCPGTCTEGLHGMILSEMRGLLESLPASVETGHRGDIGGPAEGSLVVARAFRECVVGAPRAAVDPLGRCVPAKPDESSARHSILKKRASSAVTYLGGEAPPAQAAAPSAAAPPLSVAPASTASPGPTTHARLLSRLPLELLNQVLVDPSSLASEKAASSAVTYLGGEAPPAQAAAPSAAAPPLSVAPASTASPGPTTHARLLSRLPLELLNQVLVDPSSLASEKAASSAVTYLGGEAPPAQAAAPSAAAPPLSVAPASTASPGTDARAAPLPAAARAAEPGARRPFVARQRESR
ncbi:hypothetical protein DIPPA_21617 [Diplonema papillatum]|nr:hypothetical protein DIPPA_21617 [Diplonema papillatum]